MTVSVTTEKRGAENLPAPLKLGLVSIYMRGLRAFHLRETSTSPLPLCPRPAPLPS
jgi:hypothetical protein